MTKKSKIVIALIVVLLIIDQLSKFWIKTNMSLGDAYMIFGHWFQIKFIENRGAAYGFEFGGEFGKLALTVLRIGLITAGGWYLTKLMRLGKNSLLLLIGLAMIFCGAVGNLIDSVFYGVIFSESTPWQVATLFPEGGGYESWLHGNVVDMLYFPIIDTVLPEWVPIWGGEPYIFFSPIFNLADSYITVGFALLLLFRRRELSSIV